jgi:hypothetical protein
MSPELVGLIATLLLGVFAVMGIGSRKEFPAPGMKEEVRSLSRRIFGFLAIIVGVMTFIIWL